MYKNHVQKDDLINESVDGGLEVSVLIETIFSNLYDRCTSLKIFASNVC